MEHHARELQSPPEYNNHGYKQLTEEIEFRNAPGHHVQSTVVTIMPEGPPVRDHIIWSLFNAMYLNFCCLGVIALAFSVKSRDRKLIGDKSGATSYGSTARSLNIAATVLSILSAILFISIVVILQVQLFELFRQQAEARQEQDEMNKLFG